jgi:DNA (cytosine-5)-methyltransferase 1
MPLRLIPRRDRIAFDIIRRTLTEALGYTVYHKIIDAQSVVPQHRERIFIVRFREWRDFEFPKFPAHGPKLASILEPKPDPKYTLSDHLWTYLQNYAAKHRAAGNGFGFGLVTGRDIARTLSARYHKDGSEILIAQNGGPRSATITFCGKWSRDAAKEMPTQAAQHHRESAASLRHTRRSSPRRCAVVARL